MYEDVEEYENYVKRNYRKIFEHELRGWYMELEAWPKKRTRKMFQEWLGWEIQTMLFDMALDEPLEYDPGV